MYNSQVKHKQAGPWLLPQLALMPSLLLFMLLLAGCSVAQPTDQQNKQATTPSRIAMQLMQKLQLAEPLYDEQLIFHLLAGETLGSEGDLIGAAEEYGKAAKLSRDPQVLSRAARISMQAGAWDQLDDISARWLKILPEAADALRYAALAAAQKGDVTTSTKHMIRMIHNSDPASTGWQIAATMLADLPHTAVADDIMDRLIASDEFGDDADSLYGQSVIAWQQVDRARAIELANRASAATERLEIIEWAGQLAHASGDTESAIAHYQRALQIKPGDQALTLAYVELLRSNDQLEQAIAVLRDMPASTETLYTEATYRLEDGQREQAEALLERLLLWQPEKPEPAPVTRASVMAEPDLKRVDDPRLVHAFYTAQLADQLDRKELAIDWYGRVDGGRLQSQANLRRAYLLADTGDMDAARVALQQTRENADELQAVSSYVTEANLLQSNNQAAAAVDLMTEALQKAPGNFELTYARALAAAAAGNVELAEQDFRRLIRENPENPVLLNALGYTLTDLTDRYDEAMSLLEAAMELDAEDAATLDSMGWIHYKMGDLQQAENYLQRAWEADDNPEIGAHLGEVLWLQDKHGQAMEVWRAAAELDADHNVLTSTLQRLNVQL